MLPGWILKLFVQTSRSHCNWNIASPVSGPERRVWPAVRCPCVSGFGGSQLSITANLASQKPKKQKRQIPVQKDPAGHTEKGRADASPMSWGLFELFLLASHFWDQNDPFSSVPGSLTLLQRCHFFARPSNKAAEMKR